MASLGNSFYVHSILFYYVYILLFNFIIFSISFYIILHHSILFSIILFHSSLFYSVRQFSSSYNYQYSQFSKIFHSGKQESSTMYIIVPFPSFHTPPLAAFLSLVGRNTSLYCCHLVLYGSVVCVFAMDSYSQHTRNLSWLGRNTILYSHHFVLYGCVA